MEPIVVEIHGATLLAPGKLQSQAPHELVVSPFQVGITQARLFAATHSGNDFTAYSSQECGIRTNLKRGSCNSVIEISPKCASLCMLSF